ncbi:hypothetical protein Ciccas_014003, partial [Cichlidogyrus casuarinus]
MAVLAAESTLIHRRAAMCEVDCLNKYKSMIQSDESNLRKYIKCQDDALSDMSKLLDADAQVVERTKLNLMKTHFLSVDMENDLKRIEYYLDFLKPERLTKLRKMRAQLVVSDKYPEIIRQVLERKIKLETTSHRVYADFSPHNKSMMKP